MLNPLFRHDDRAIWPQKWEAVAAVTTVLIAIAAAGMGARWVTTSAEENLAQAEVARLRALPSLEFAFEAAIAKEEASGPTAVISVRLSNSGLRPIIINLKRTAPMTITPLGENGKPLDSPAADLQYERVDDPTPWHSVLIGAGSSRSIPFVWPSPEPGLFAVQFTGSMTDADASEFRKLSGLPDEPWWSGSAILEVRDEETLRARILPGSNPTE